MCWGPSENLEYDTGKSKFQGEKSPRRTDLLGGYLVPLAVLHPGAFTKILRYTKIY